MSATRLLIAVLVSCAVCAGVWHGLSGPPSTSGAASAEFERSFSEAPEVFDLRAGVAAMAIADAPDDAHKDLRLDIEALEHFKAGDLLFAEGALSEARAESGWTPFRRVLAAELLLAAPETFDSTANLDDAMAHLDEVDAPEWSERAALLRAEIGRRRGDDTRALEELEELVNTSTGLGLALASTRASNLHLERGEFDLAHALATQAVETEPEHLEGWLARGRAARALSRRTRNNLGDEGGDQRGAETSGELADREVTLSDARLAFQAALEIENTSGEAELGLGLCALDAYAAGDDALQAAVLHFERAHELLPNDDAPLLAMGDALVSIGELDGALEHYRSALQLQESVTGYLKLAGVQFQRGAYEDAELAFRRAIRGARTTQTSNLEFAAAHNGLGAALLAQGHETQARAAFEQAVALNPQDPAPRRNLERLL